MLDHHSKASLASTDDAKLAGEVVARFHNNVFSDDISANPVGLEFSRLDHSCVPNAFYSWNRATEEIVVRAILDIKEDEEILISYVPVSFPRCARARHLKPYRFDCACAACQTGTGYSKESENRRVHKLHPLNQILRPAEQALEDETIDSSRTVFQQMLFCKEDLDYLEPESTMKADKATT